MSTEERLSELERIVKLLIPVAVAPKTNAFRCYWCGTPLESVVNPDHPRMITGKSRCPNTECPADALIQYYRS